MKTNNSSTSWDSSEPSAEAWVVVGAKIENNGVYYSLIFMYKSIVLISYSIRDRISNLYHYYIQKQVLRLILMASM